MPPSPEAKQCTKCKLIKPLGDFYKATRTKTGRTYVYSHCKACLYVYRDQNKPRLREYSKRYYQHNGDAIKRRNKAWRFESGYNSVMAVKRWRAANREAYNALDRAYKGLRRSPVYQLAWPRILKAYNGKCLCCRSEMNVGADHVIPLIQAPHLNCVANLQPLCRACNSAKHATAKDYRPEKGALELAIGAAALKEWENAKAYGIKGRRKTKRPMREWVYGGDVISQNVQGDHKIE
jgi:5-methylcytosine-specific restriction endonuclease McrA